MGCSRQEARICQTSWICIGHIFFFQGISPDSMSHETLDPVTTFWAFALLQRALLLCCVALEMDCVLQRGPMLLDTVSTLTLLSLSLSLTSTSLVRSNRRLAFNRRVDLLVHLSCSTVHPTIDRIRRRARGISVKEHPSLLLSEFQGKRLPRFFPTPFKS